ESSMKSRFLPVQRIRGYRHALPAPLRGREEAAVAAGRWGWSANTVQPETQATGDGAFRPLPVSPSPTGAISRRHTARNRQPFCRQREHPTEIPFPLPGDVTTI
ncbi:MAG: hypothetical protein WBJ51_05245, partial [Methanoculleus sp.]